MSNICAELFSPSSAQNCGQVFSAPDFGEALVYWKEEGVKNNKLFDNSGKFPDLIIYASDISSNNNQLGQTSDNFKVSSFYYIFTKNIKLKRIEQHPPK